MPRDEAHHVPCGHRALNVVLALSLLCTASLSLAAIGKGPYSGWTRAAAAAAGSGGRAAAEASAGFAWASTTLLTSVVSPSSSPSVLKTASTRTSLWQLGGALYTAGAVSCGFLVFSTAFAVAGAALLLFCGGGAGRQRRRRRGKRETVLALGLTALCLGFALLLSLVVFIGTSAKSVRALARREAARAAEESAALSAAGSLEPQPQPPLEAASIVGGGASPDWGLFAAVLAACSWLWTGTWLLARGIGGGSGSGSGGGGEEPSGVEGEEPSDVEGEKPSDVEVAGAADKTPPSSSHSRSPHDAASTTTTAAATSGGAWGPSGGGVGIKSSETGKTEAEGEDGGGNATTSLSGSRSGGSWRKGFTGAWKK